MVDPKNRMPKKVYTVGDTVRLEISFVSETNIEEIEAVYLRQETSTFEVEEGVGRNISKSTITFEGTVEEVEALDDKPYVVARKRHAATLISFVDKDHTSGSYWLARLQLRTAGGMVIDIKEDSDISAEPFRIADETFGVEEIKIQIANETTED